MTITLVKNDNYCDQWGIVDHHLFVNGSENVTLVVSYGIDNLYCVGIKENCEAYHVDLVKGFNSYDECTKYAEKLSKKHSIQIINNVK